MPAALTLVLVVIAAWLVLGAAGLAVPRRLRFISQVLFPASALVGLLLAIVALAAIGSVPQTAVLPLGLPDLPFHVRLDALSAFFLLVLGAAGAAVSLFSAGYFRDHAGMKTSAPALAPNPALRAAFRDAMNAPCSLDSAGAMRTTPTEGAIE